MLITKMMREDSCTLEDSKGKKGVPVEMIPDCEQV